MRQHTSALKDVLTGSFTRRIFVNVFHGSDRVAEGLAFTSWSFDGDLGAEVGYSGSGVIVCESVDGESWSPTGTEGVLSPFRARLELVMEISAGEFTEQVSLGMVKVVKVPSAEDQTVVVDGRTRVVSSRVAVSFLSTDEALRRRGFRFPDTSKAGVSVWGEVRRLSAFPVEESVPDVTVPSLKTWEAAQGGRLKALHELGRLLGGTLVVNSRGALTLVPDEMPAPVGVLQLGESGTVTEIEAEIDTDGVYNEVVGTFEDANRNPIYSVASVATGDLAPDGLYGTNTRYYSSDLVKTQAQADAAVKAVLNESISSLMYDVQVQCLINPLVEIGDVWQVDGWNRPLVGRVVKVGLFDSPLMTLTLRVKRVLV